MMARLSLAFPALPGLRYRSLPRAGWLTWLRIAIARWHERRLLEMLDERMLRDIGINRSQALAEARKPCWRG